MICKAGGSPAMARSSHSRQSRASCSKPAAISEVRVMVASRSQQKR
jgi:hypothetical protein